MGTEKEIRSSPYAEVGIGMGWGGVGPHGRGPLEAQRDPMGGIPDPPWEGNPWEPKVSHGTGPLGPQWEPLNLNGNAHIKWERPLNGKSH